MRKYAAILIAMAVLLLASSAYAAISDKGVFNNRIRTSFVQVSVTPLHLKDEELSPIIEPVTVMPGEKVSYIPRVKVAGEKSYVRLQFDSEMNEDAGIKISCNNVYGTDNKWIRRGDTFYCTEAIEAGETSDVFKGFKMPQFDESAGCTGFVTNIKADAIQAEHFNPDFSKASPWGSVEIQASVATEKIGVKSGSTADSNGSTEVRAVRGSTDNEMNIRGNSTLECPVTDLFDGFGEMIPGDSRRGNLSMKNHSKMLSRVYFYAESQGSGSLLETIELKMFSNGRMVYEGKLDASDMDKPLQIAEIDPGSEANLDFEIRLPESADNDLMNSDEEVRWIFDVRSSEPGIVRTGDAGAVALPGALLLCTLMAIVITGLLLRRSRRDKERK